MQARNHAAPSLPSACIFLIVSNIGVDDGWLGYFSFWWLLCNYNCWLALMLIFTKYYAQQ
jgi:hypothetical protein